MEVKCSNCEHCKIAYGRIDTECAYARCTKLPSKRTEGKIITWAMTTYHCIESSIDPMLGRYKLYKLGVDRVRESLQRKKQAPKFCPLRKEVTK